jgi:UDP-GlcNAc:undecaprenyl-phosphate GlcNAc-1-phosphate transferase
MQTLLLNAAISFVAAACITPLVRFLAWRAGVVDRPDGQRKAHGRPVALLGGVALFAAISIAVAVAMWIGWLPGAHVKGKFLVGIVVSAFLLMFGGAWDDARNLRPWKQVIWPIAAALVIVASGVGITFVTNPFGGQLLLNGYSVTVLWLAGIPYKVTPLADAFTVLWLLGMTYTTKFLDGLDGLVSGVTVIGALVVAAVSMMREVSQPDTAVLAVIVAAAFAGFLIFNGGPASIFLGEGGSTMSGFLLGTLAIISGGKIATTLLVLGLPIFDAAFVIVRRLLQKKSPTSGDRLHLHFRLLDFGWSQRQVVLLYYFVAALFGTSTLILQGWEKVVAIGMVVSILIALTAVAMLTYRKKA